MPETKVYTMSRDNAPTDHTALISVIVPVYNESATVREILGHAFSDGDLSETEWSVLDERVVVATVLPNARFDWSRTWLGVVTGIHGPCEQGDRCRARVWLPR